jgi:hypothetical protein
MKGRMHMGKDNFRDTTDISQLPLRTINLVWLDNSGEFHANYPESIASTIRNCRSPVELFGVSKLDFIRAQDEVDARSLFSSAIGVCKQYISSNAGCWMLDAGARDAHFIVIFNSWFFVARSYIRDSSTSIPWNFLSASDRNNDTFAAVVIGDDIFP